MNKLIIKNIKVDNILTKSNLPVCDFSVNPYVGCQHACKYCYASFMKRFTGHLEPWGSFVDVKEWNDLKNISKLKDKEIFMSSVTDPYQPLEAKTQTTRKLLMQLLGSGVKLSISTKSDLILRDLDLIKQFPGARVAWSINTLDENFKNEMDLGVSIKRRLEVMKAFHTAGIRTTCFISPIFLGITDCKAIIEAAKPYCNLIWLENLNLRGDYKPVILEYIANKHPKLVPLYEAIYKHKDRSYWNDLNLEMQAFCKQHKFVYVRNDDSHKYPFESPPVVVNYFFHEEVKKSSNKLKSEHA